MVYYNALPIGRLWNEQTLYAQKWEDRISGEFVSKYAVFSHKGGVRILADKSAKDKPPSVVGFSRLTLLDCLTTRVYLDNTRTRMRVLFYMVICASVFAENWGWRSATERTPSIAPEESPLWGVSAIHRTKSSPLVPLAWFSKSRLPKHFCAHWSQHLPCRCFSLFIAPEWYSGAFSRKSTFLKNSLLFIFSLPSPILPRDEREKTERTTAQLPANKKWLNLKKVDSITDI